MTRRRVPSWESRAATELSHSLMPNLHADPVLNAVAISFFNPGTSLNEAMKAARAISELRRLARKARRRGR